jgi:ceramide glucosyltransferase
VAPLVAAALAAPIVELDGVLAAALLAVVWFGTEALLARGAGWHLSFASPLAWLVRDIALPLIWLKGWTGDGFNWRGNDMTVAEPATATGQTRG